MQEVKDSRQALVRIGYDGKVHKTYRGVMARERFANETRVLRYLEEKGCTFVPLLLEADEESLYVVTSNMGQIVTRISDEKVAALFKELEAYGVRHEDREARNVTYSGQQGRFCLIDFEFSTILETGEGLTLDHPGFKNRHELK